MDILLAGVFFLCLLVALGVSSVFIGIGLAKAFIRLMGMLDYHDIKYDHPPIPALSLYERSASSACDRCDNVNRDG